MSTGSVTARRTSGPGYFRLVGSEWLKLWTLRSTWWCFGIMVIVATGLSYLISSRFGEDNLPSGSASAQAQSLVQGSASSMVTMVVAFSVLALGVLGSLVMSGEYSSGMVRSSFAAAPGRLGVLFAKLLAFALSTAAVGAVTVALGVAVTLPAMLGVSTPLDLADPMYLQTLGMEVLYLVLVGAMALFVGAIIAAPAGAIATTMGIFLVLPTIVSVLRLFIDADWPRNIQPFLPSGLGSTMTSYVSDSYTVGGAAEAGSGIISFDPIPAAAVLLGEVVVLGIVAAIVTKRRDV